MKPTCLLVVVIGFAFAAVAEESETQIEFLSVEQGGDVIAGDDDQFFSKLFPREAAAMTQVAPGNKSLEETRQAAREFFRKSVLEHTHDEKSTLSQVVDQVVEKFGSEYPLLVHHPWRFIKSRTVLCGGFSFTRDDCIVLSKATLRRIVDDLKKPQPTGYGEALLLHEQMHVLQRESPELFRPLYESLFGFRAAPVIVHPWIDERQVTNPDGVSDDWVLDVRTDANETAPYWIGTILRGEKEVHTMGRDFVGVAVPLERQQNGNYEMRLDEEGKPALIPIAELTAMTSRLPIRRGYDHPNEVAAYLLTVVTHGPRGPAPTGEAAKLLEAGAAWFRKYLKRNSNEATPS